MYHNLQNHLWWGYMGTLMKSPKEYLLFYAYKFCLYKNKQNMTTDTFLKDSFYQVSNLCTIIQHVIRALFALVYFKTIMLY